MAGKLNKEIVQKVCDKLADGLSLSKVCLARDMPARRTFLEAVQRNEEFYEMYQQARAIQAEILADEMFDIARQDLGNVEKQLANAEVQRRRVHIDTLKWTFAKMQQRGLRNKAEDQTGNNQIVLSWSNSSDDVTARKLDEGEAESVDAKVIKLGDTAS